MAASLSSLLQATDPRKRAQEFNVRTRREARENAVIQVLNDIKGEAGTFNPINAVVSGVAGFLTGGPVGAAAAVATAPKGRTTPLRSAAQGAGAGGIGGQLGAAAGAPAATTAGPASGLLGQLTGGAPTTTTTGIPGATPGIVPGAPTPTTALPAAAPPSGFDLGRLISPEQIATTAPLVKGLVSGKPFEGLLAARQADVSSQDRQRALKKDDLANELTRAQIDKLNASAAKLALPGGEKGVFQVIKGRKQLVDPKTGALIKDFGINVSGDDITKANQGLFSVKQIRTILAPILDNTESFLDFQARIAKTKLGLFATTEGRKLRGSFRNAVDVILRKRTGAVINPEEFDQAMEAWGLQVGDSPEVMRKKINDLEAMLKLSSGEIDPSTPEGQEAESLLLDLANLTSEFQVQDVDAAQVENFKTQFQQQFGKLPTDIQISKWKQTHGIQ